MRDEDRVCITAERLVQRDLVGDHRAAVNVVAVVGKLGRREPAVEWSHRPVSRLSERWEQVAVAKGESGKPCTHSASGPSPCVRHSNVNWLARTVPPLEVLHGATPFDLPAWRCQRPSTQLCKPLALRPARLPSCHVFPRSVCSATSRLQIRLRTGALTCAY